MPNLTDQLRTVLDRANGGLSTRSLAETLAVGDAPETLGAIELLCVLSADLRFAEGAWHTTRAGKTSMVLAALENYVAATGKRVFRGAVALHALPAESLPTEEDLGEIVAGSGGRFVLLPNQMIKCQK